MTKSPGRPRGVVDAIDRWASSIIDRFVSDALSDTEGEELCP